MAFERVYIDKKKPGLTPLADMVFLLLIFFLVTSFVGTGTFSEKNLLIPTPLHKEGDMNILIQLYRTEVGEFKAYYIDDTINRAYYLIREGSDERFPNLVREDDFVKLNERLFRVIEWDYNFTFTQLKEQLKELELSKTPLFIGIRGPWDIPYFKIIELISFIPVESKYNWPIRYGIIEGDRESLFCARIIPEIEKNRIKSILIDLSKL